MKSLSELQIRVLTHNIRYATSAPFKGELPWAGRKQLILNELEYTSRYRGETFVCLQEVLHSQLIDLLSGLNEGPGPDWAYIGVGRDDGREAGEYSPIFYMPSIWELLHWRTTWLSETPKIPSKGWDAASIRLVTIGIFAHRASRQRVLALNTHLDDQGSRSRLEAARIILGVIRECHEAEHGELILGTFLAGDLNSEETQEAYVELTTVGDLRDTCKLVKEPRRYGNENTYTGFGYEDEPPSRIDYVLVDSMVSPGWMVNGYAVLANRFDDGVFNSDHRAVVADLMLVG